MNSNCDSSPQVLRTSLLALCYSANEYASPVWYHSAHSKQVDVALNDTCRIINGCLQPTPMDKVQRLAGIASPQKGANESKPPSLCIQSTK